MPDKDISLDIRNTMLSQDDHYQPIFPRKNKMKMAAIMGLALIGVVGAVLGIQATEELPLLNVDH